MPVSKRDGFFIAMNHVQAAPDSVRFKLIQDAQDILDIALITSIFFLQTAGIPRIIVNHTAIGINILKIGFKIIELEEWPQGRGRETADNINDLFFFLGCFYFLASSGMGMKWQDSKFVFYGNFFVPVLQKSVRLISKRFFSEAAY